MKLLAELISPNLKVSLIQEGQSNQKDTKFLYLHLSGMAWPWDLSFILFSY